MIKTVCVCVCVTDFANGMDAHVEFSCMVFFGVCDHDDVHAS